VQLVHEARGESAEGDELFAMQRLNLIGLKAYRAVGKDSLADGGAAGQKGPEVLLGETEKN
jgi:hypothetical protein